MMKNIIELQKLNVNQLIAYYFSIAFDNLNLQIALIVEINT